MNRNEKHGRHSQLQETPSTTNWNTAPQRRERAASYPPPTLPLPWNVEQVGGNEKIVTTTTTTFPYYLEPHFAATFEDKERIRHHLLPINHCRSQSNMQESDHLLDPKVVEQQRKDFEKRRVQAFDAKLLRHKH